MHDENTEFLPAQFEPFDMCGDKVDQEESTEQVTAGINGQLETAARRLPPDKVTVKKLVLNDVEPELHLRDRADKHQAERKRQTHDREFQGSKKVQYDFHSFPY